jgi:hypothetical protein
MAYFEVVLHLFDRFVQWVPKLDLGSVVIHHSQGTKFLDLCESLAKAVDTADVRLECEDFY